MSTPNNLTVQPRRGRGRPKDALRVDNVSHSALPATGRANGSNCSTAPNSNETQEKKQTVDELKEFEALFQGGSLLQKVLDQSVQLENSTNTFNQNHGMKKRGRKPRNRPLGGDMFSINSSDL